MKFIPPIQRSYVIFITAPWLLVFVLISAPVVLAHDGSRQERFMTDYRYDNFVKTLPQPFRKLLTIYVKEDVTQFERCSYLGEEDAHILDCRSLNERKDDDQVQEQRHRLQLQLQHIADDEPLTKLRKVTFSCNMLSMSSRFYDQVLHFNTKLVKDTYVKEQLGIYVNTHKGIEKSTDYHNFLGFKFDLRTKLGNHSVICPGELLLGINSSSPLRIGYSHDHLEYLYEKVITYVANDVPDTSDGYLFVMRLSCQEAEHESSKLAVEFGARHQELFPYVTLTHHMHHIPNLREYLFYSKLYQISDDMVNIRQPDRYNTTFMITSSSDRHKWLNFDFEEQFTEEDFDRIYEMAMMLAPLIHTYTGGDMEKLIYFAQMFMKKSWDKSDIFNNDLYGPILELIAKSNDAKDGFELASKLKKEILERFGNSMSLGDLQNFLLGLTLPIDELAPKLSKVFGSLSKGNETQKTRHSNKYSHEEL